MSEPRGLDPDNLLGFRPQKLATYELVIEGPDWSELEREPHEAQHLRLKFFSDLPAFLEEVEENLTDLAPEGYRIHIRRRD